MSYSLTISISDNATPALAALQRTLVSRRRLHERIAEEEEVLFRDYLRGIASRRHATASQLGATPTGELERAAKNPEGTANDGGANVSLRPGHLFARAFGDINIVPQGGKRYLTIPVNAAAYGKRAGQFGGSLRFMRVGPRKQAILAVKSGKGMMTTMYVLVSRVRQKQDRTLLPDVAAITGAAEAAATKILQEDGLI